MFLLIFLSACQTNNFTISVGYKKMEMYVGESYTLTTNYEDFNEEGTVIWESSDSSVASVSEDGEINALALGSTYITATFNNYVTRIYLIVYEEEVKRTITITGTQMVLVDKTTTLNANIELKEGEYLQWTSSNEKVASVTSNGIVTGVKTGLVSIRASLSSDESIYDDINVLVRSGDGTQDVIINQIYNKTNEYIGTTDLTSLSNKIVNTIANVKDAIIGVSNYQKSGTSLVQSGVGSGVIYKKENLDGGTYKYTLLTNYHVVEDATTLKVYIGGEVDKEFSAELIKTDEDNDLAIVSFEYDKEITPIEFATETETQTGDFVLAIGNPNGYDYYNSVTFGMASYIGRTISGEKASFIQHDAAINPGNSGGALINLDGKLIGINTMKIAKVTVEGMGFAIDLKTVNAFINA